MIWNGVAITPTNGVSNGLGAAVSPVATLMTNASTTENIITRGATGHTFTIDWGDGASEAVTHTGLGNDITTPHTYSSGAEKTITFSGAITGITKLRFAGWGASLYGDIAGIATLTGLTVLELILTNVAGDLSALDPMSSLVTVNITPQGAAVSGSVAGLSSTITTLRLPYCAGLTGQISDLQSTAFSELYLNNGGIGVTSGAIAGAWAGTIYLHNCSMTSTEVDNALIQINAAGGSSGTLRVDGNNAVRTAASDAALAALLGRGWTVTVNE